jgi:hypothetical protein
MRSLRKIDYQIPDGYTRLGYRWMLFKYFDMFYVNKFFDTLPLKLKIWRNERTIKRIERRIRAIEGKTA